jgi:hypothetical protein
MYMNRLRHDDFINLFQNVNCKILIEEPDIDESLLLQKSDFKLNSKFKSKPDEVITIIGSWLVSNHNI